MEKLWEWQQLRQQYWRKQESLKKNPAVIALRKEKQEIAEAELVLKEQEEKLGKLQGRARKVGDQHRETADKAKRLEAKLYAGETNNPKDLLSIQHQVETFQEEAARLAEEKARLIAEITRLQQEMAVYRRHLKERRESYREKLAIYNREKEQAELQLAILMGQIMELTEEIPLEILAHYQELEQRFPQSALARLEGKMCSACRVEISALAIRELKKGQGLVHCENCGRILFR